LYLNHIQPYPYNRHQAFKKSQASINLPFTPQQKKTPNLQALTNPTNYKPLPTQPTPPKLQLSCKTLTTSNHHKTIARPLKNSQNEHFTKNL
jgi:hypothetical protein